MRIDAIAGFDLSVGRDREQIAAGPTSLAHAHVPSGSVNEVVDILDNRRDCEPIKLTVYNCIKQFIPRVDQFVDFKIQLRMRTPPTDWLKEGPVPAAQSDSLK